MPLIFEGKVQSEGLHALADRDADRESCGGESRTDWELVGHQRKKARTSEVRAFRVSISIACSSLAAVTLARVLGSQYTADQGSE